MIVLGVHAVLMMLKSQADSAQGALEASLARVANQTPRPQLHDTLIGSSRTDCITRSTGGGRHLLSTRRGRPFALYSDLDNFGQINDHGRNAGDRVLQIIAVSACARPFAAKYHRGTPWRRRIRHPR
ncbi:hypothetical protein ACU4HD_44195 [Cupriavidus basilensis]